MYATFHRRVFHHCSVLLLLGLAASLIPIRGAVANAEALPLVCPIFGDHMVLQRNKPNTLWGWAKPGSEIQVELSGKKTSAHTGADGRWQANLPPLPAGGPHVLKIDGPQHVELTDILIGDVWLCGGQSNMELGLTRAHDGAAEAKAANHPGIRLFRVAGKPAYRAAPLPQGKWQVCTPESFTTGSGFSAVAYYFGRKIHAETGVPIGLIQSAVGGTPAETWMSPDSLRKMPDFVPALDEIARLNALGGEQYGNYISHWYDAYDRGQKAGWSTVDFDDSAWKSTTLKSAFADLGVPETPAVCWLRREITLPTPLPAGAAKILLGVVEKMDTVYINGRWTGASSWVENPRAYTIGDGVLRPGKNQITLRVLKTKPDGGFKNPTADLKIVLGDRTRLVLEGDWKGIVSVDARPPHPLPLGYENYPTMPSVLFLGMIRPLAPLALTGALWYQGEANQYKPQQYHTLLSTLIADWRAAFGQGDFPFYIVSLPVFTARHAEPIETADGWTGIREAQTLTAQTVANTGLAITIDTGAAKDIHPDEKLPVGERLALLALKNVHGRDVVCAGPAFEKLDVLRGRLRIHFSHTEGGLVCKGDKLGEFSVAGADHVWHWAEARIKGKTVIVSSKAVPNPVDVRYAWQANPLATLYNGAGLPAEPFRTDK